MPWDNQIYTLIVIGFFVGVIRYSQHYNEKWMPMYKYKYIFLCIVIFVVELQRITKTCNYRKILYENEK